MGIYVEPENRKYLWLTSALLFIAAFGIKLVARQMPKDSWFLTRKPVAHSPGPSSYAPLNEPAHFFPIPVSPAETVSLFVFTLGLVPIVVILYSRQFDEDNEML